MKAIIKTENLSKTYGSVQAVNGISLNVKKGEIYGFLGINGAGKTTTIRMLLGMVSPTAGTAYLFGEKVSPDKNELWRRVGYIVECPSFYPDLTVFENLEVARRLRKITDKKSIDEIIESLKLTPYRNRKARNLSTGNKQRLGLAKALLHTPEILLLDEPSSGLDPAGIVEIRKLLVDLAVNHEVAIFISSHILSEISKLVNRIGIIHQGQLLQEVDRDELEKFREKRLVIKTDQQKRAMQELIKSGIADVEEKEGMLEIRDRKAIEHPEKIAKMMVETGFPPGYLKVEEEDLETYFLRSIGMTGGDIK